MVAANVTYEMVEEAYKKNKYNGLLQILGKDENGAVKVTKSKKIIKNIFTFFENEEQK